MNLRRFLAEAMTLAGLAVLCALLSNAFAGKERRLALPGDYPNATRWSPGAEPPPVSAVERIPSEQPPSGPGEPSAASPTAPPSPTQATATTTRPAPLPAGGPAPTTPKSVATKPGGATRETVLLERYPAHGKPFVEITGDAAAWLHSHGALFLDARRSKDFEAGHVAGARSFPVWESELVKERVEALLAEGRDGALPVVLYCSGGDCEDSHLLAQMLFGAGFENLLVYRDGFPGWLKRSGAVAAGGPA